MGPGTVARERAALVAALTEELGLIRPDADRVAADCAALEGLLGPGDDAALSRSLSALAAAAAESGLAAAEPVLALIASRLPHLAHPSAVLAPLFEAGDARVADRARDLLLQALADGAVVLDRALLLVLAGGQQDEAGADADAGEGSMDLAARVLAGSPAARRALRTILARDRDPRLRLLAARLLDRGGTPAGPEEARAVLGARAAEALGPYLAFSQAGCRDLLAVAAAGPRGRAPAAVFLPAAAERWGEPLVRRLVAELGWERLNAGLDIREMAEVVVPGQPPASFPPLQAALLAGAGAQQGRRRLVVQAHGLAAAPSGRGPRSRDPVQRFRRLNTNHADLLALILDVAPLDEAKVGRIVGAMDRIVADYTTLFAEAGEECAVLPDLWRDLRTRTMDLLAGASGARTLPADLTRLVLMFEDPPTIGAVRTIHGLKRFLHQKGLKRGFALVDAAEAPNRTLDVVVVQPGGRLQRAAPIRYASFETAAALGGGPAPLPLRMLADAWVRALLAGRTSFPDANVFLFGNEVQYYLFFRNHPVFLRIDFSPPQRGGMFDLEYYGVSGYELDSHPNPALDAIRRFFRDLDCDVGLEGVRLQVRYDKERCRDLEDLCDHAEAVLRLAPWLMELDWLIGSLRLTGEGRRLLTEAWSARFRDAGVLPLDAVLTADRLGVIAAVEPGPAGPAERRWDGADPYGDLFSGAPGAEFLANLRQAAAALGLAPPPGSAEGQRDAPGLLALERRYLSPLAGAAAAGLVTADDQGTAMPADPGRVRQRHPAEAFAALLAGKDQPLQRAADLAGPLAAVERFVRFTVVGAVGALEVASARLPVLGGALHLAVLRDRHGRIRLGMATAGAPPAARRSSGRHCWRDDPGLDAAATWELLRGANYVGGALKPPATAVPDLADLRMDAVTVPRRGQDPTGTGPVLAGLKAAPGRAVGRALLGTGRRSEDASGAVLVARELGPADNACLMRAAGVVTTGGAVLSHAALLAIQYGKPALLVEASWAEAASGGASLRFITDEQETTAHEVAGLPVLIRRAVGRRTVTLRDGDLVVIDAGEGTLRVLGQERDTLGLHDGLRLLGEAAAQASAADRDADVLAARALHLRAAHQVGRILDRLHDPALAAFAVEDIVTNPALASLAGRERARLLVRLLANPTAAAAAGAALAAVAERLAETARAAAAQARAGLPAARQAAEVVGLRLRAVRAFRLHAACAAVLAGCGLDAPRVHDPADLDALARDRLALLAAADRAALSGSGRDRTLPMDARHRLRHLERCFALLGRPAPGSGLPVRLADQDARALAAAAGALVLPAQECGFALQPLIGWKAANLGEMARLSGPAACPPWFVVTDHALDRMLEQPCMGGTLRQAIAAALDEPGAGPAARAAAIAALWRDVAMPTDLAAAVGDALNILSGGDESVPVAVRSSSCDEDTEIATRAGEFETFLNVQGAGAVAAHLRRAWAGLWGVRALEARAADPAAAAWPRGGLIVQRLVDARVAGVVQTVNLARGDLGEMVVNAGLGLGEGVVSGVAAADLVTIVKPRADEPVGDLQFTYLTAEKPVQIVRDERRGGTRRAETLYHQRLRPALEYVELCELVERCLALEAAYGYPLDLEFAIEGHTLWLLQARPMATILGELHETLARHPLAAPAAAARHPRKGVEP